MLPYIIINITIMISTLVLLNAYIYINNIFNIIYTILIIIYNILLYLLYIYNLYYFNFFFYRFLILKKKNSYKKAIFYT